MLRFIIADGQDQEAYVRFQYIPCYGLSRKSKNRPWSKFAFQYIPCYGLSELSGVVADEEKKFQYIPCYGLSSRRVLFPGNMEISIHPMLRFIIIIQLSCGIHSSFQYIPCYGLSSLEREEKP